MIERLCGYSLQCSLQGKFSYEKVEKINKLTGHSVRYGYCPEKGPVAVMGIPSPKKKFNVFREVWEYGNYSPVYDYRFEEYSMEKAKEIKNYKVYSFLGINQLKGLVKFDKINILDDSRSKIKEDERPKIINMDAMFKGIYTYKEAIRFVKQNDFRNQGNSIVFAVLEDGRNIGIIGTWYFTAQKTRGFKDVWEYGKTEPKVQSICFMSDRIAKKITDFTLYMYDLSLPSDFSKSNLFLKLDRTTHPNFDFYATESGIDYRLEERTELLVEECENE